MKTKLLLGFFLMAGILSCEKNENKSDVPKPKKADYFPLGTGSYWVYNTYIIDSLGNETLKSENDTLSIIGDTTINGNTYSIFYGKRYGVSTSLEKRFYRDSLGYIVNEEGKIVFSSDNFTDTLDIKYTPDMENPMYYQFKMMKKVEDKITLPAGVFDSVLNSRLSVYYYNPLIEHLRDNDYLYAPNVGKILWQYFYYGGFVNRKSYIEERLVAYKIAETV